MHAQHGHTLYVVGLRACSCACWPCGHVICACLLSLCSILMHGLWVQDVTSPTMPVPHSKPVQKFLNFPRESSSKKIKITAACMAAKSWKDLLSRTAAIEAGVYLCAMQPGCLGVGAYRSKPFHVPANPITSRYHASALVKAYTELACCGCHRACLGRCMKITSNTQFEGICMPVLQL